MDGTDTLLDFGDGPLSPQSAPLAPSGGANLDPTPNGDPFDPFGDALFGGAEVMTSDVAQTSQGFSFADDTDFDPFASPKMSAAETATTNGTTPDVSQDQQQNYEAQFADLLGDLGDGSPATLNGEVNGTVTTVTKTTTEVSEGGDVITNSTVTVETDSDGGQPHKVHGIWPPEDVSKRVDARLHQKALGEKIQEPDPSAQVSPSVKEDKKAIDYMKERYQGKEEHERVKIIREPKKLDHQWGKSPSEDPEPDEATKGLPREQDLVSYTSLGTDYGRKQYEKQVEKETASKEGRVLIPVNRQQVEKVAPPEITKSVRAMFETGNLTDLHEVKKTRIDEPPPESGVYENDPAELEGVVRSSDINMEGEELKKGMTKDLLDDWKTKGQDEGPKERKAINMAEDEGKILENEPTVRSDVCRESDADVTEQIVLQKGHAKNLKDQLLNRKDDQKERKPIKLCENDEAATVFENVPEKLEGVVRADDMTDEVKFERGNAKNLKGFWATRTDDVEVKREKIVIDKESGPTVLESEPEVLEGVVRASDVPDSEKEIAIDSGRTKNMATMWGRKSEEDGPKAARQPIKLDLSNTGPTITENNPVELEGVVRSDTTVEDIIPGNRGRTKDIAGKFLQTEEVDDRPRKQIEIERSTEPIVLENEPAPPPEGVVRSESTNEDVALESGRTKNLLSQWANKETENLSPKNSYSTSAGKTSWLKEIEAARESGVYENEPAVNEDIVRETDIPDSEKEQLIPDNYAKSMRNVWKQKEEDELNPAVKDSSELVRFTPPREITPPPVHQQEYQSIQKLTLTPQLQNAAHVNGVDPAQQHEAQYQQQLHAAQQQQLAAQKQQQVAQQNRQRQRQRQQEHEQQMQSPPLSEDAPYENGPPAQTVKSSTMLVLK